MNNGDLRVSTHFGLCYIRIVVTSELLIFECRSIPFEVILCGKLVLTSSDYQNQRSECLPGIFCSGCKWVRKCARNLPLNIREAANAFEDDNNDSSVCRPELSLEDEFMNSMLLKGKRVKKGGVRLYQNGI